MALFLSYDDPAPKISGLNRTQQVHRIVDFFSAAQVVSEHILYVPLTTKFEDPNEGLDAAIDLLAISAGPCAGITRVFRSQAEFVEHQRTIASRSYVSSWTMTKESVAMWALYSTDHSSVQITTTIASLEQAASALAAVDANPMPAITSGAQSGQFLNSSKISAVQYDDLSSIGRKIDRRRRAYDKLTGTGKIVPHKSLTAMSDRDSFRSMQYQFSALELKDSSFAHESEIRLVLTYSPYTPSTLAVAAISLQEMLARPDTNINLPEHDSAMLAYARAILREEALRQKLVCKDSISLPLQPDFISNVTIDPRCSPHKRNFIQAYFKTYGIPVLESKCFGHASSHFSVTPRVPLNQEGN